MFWAETIGSDVRLHLVIDDKYWTVLDTAPGSPYTVNGRPGMRMNSTVVANLMFIKNLRFFNWDSHNFVNPLQEVEGGADNNYARSALTGTGSTLLALQQGIVPGDDDGTGKTKIILIGRAP